MYGIFKLVINYFQKFSKEASLKKQKESFSQEYLVILQKLNVARTLTELFKSRAEIIEFQKAIKSIGSPDWGNTQVKILDARWQLRYRLWKLRG